MTDYRETAMEALSQTSLTPKQRQEAIQALDPLLKPAGAVVYEVPESGLHILTIGTCHVFGITFPRADIADRDDVEIAIDDLLALKEKVESNFDSDSAQAVIASIEANIARFRDVLTSFEDDQ